MHIKHDVLETLLLPHPTCPTPTTSRHLLQLLVVVLLMVPLLVPPNPAHATLPCASQPTAITGPTLALTNTSKQGREAHHRS